MCPLPDVAIVRQTRRPRKPLDRANPRGQRQAAIGRAAGNRRQHGGRRVFHLTLFNLQLQPCKLIVPQLPLRQQQVHFQVVDQPQRQPGQPLSRPFRVQPFGRLLLFEVVLPQQVFDPVDRPRPLPAQALPHRRQLPILGFTLGGRLHAPHAFHPLPRQQPPAVDPQQPAELVGVAAVGLLLGPLFHLNEHRFAAAVLGQHFQQPVVEAADFDDCRKPPVGLGKPPQFVEKPPHPLPFRRNLPSQHGIAGLIADTDGQLLAMLVDSKV